MIVSSEENESIKNNRTFYHFNHTIRYTCDNNNDDKKQYRLIGNDTATCTEEGSFDNQNVSCEGRF